MGITLFIGVVKHRLPFVWPYLLAPVLGICIPVFVSHCVHVFVDLGVVCNVRVYVWLCLGGCSVVQCCLCACVSLFASHVCLFVRERESGVFGAMPPAL